MNKKLVRILSILLILGSFLIGAYYYTKMPAQIASHWNASGEADGYSSKFWGLFLLPMITLGTYLLLLAVPKIDPKKGNIAKFMGYYDTFVLIMVSFLTYLHILTISWNLGSRFDMIQYLAPAFALLFFYIGILVSKAEPNWTIGVRTPWTLSSEEVWRKTHKLGGRLFKYSALIGLLGVFAGRFAIFFVIGPVIITALWTTVYSYLEYKKEANGR